MDGTQCLQRTIKLGGEGSGCKGWRCPKTDKWIDRWTGKQMCQIQKPRPWSFEEEAYKWQVWHLQMEVALMGKVNAAGIPPGPSACTCPTTSYLRHSLDLQRGSQAGLVDSKQPLMQRPRCEAFKKAVAISAVAWRARASSLQAGVSLSIYSKDVLSTYCVPCYMHVPSALGMT